MIALALLAVLGPHAAEARLHAGDPEGAWVRATPGPIPFAVAGPAVSRRVYGYLPYWVSRSPGDLRWSLLTDVIAFSADIAGDGTVTNAHALPGAALISEAHAGGARVHLCATLFNSSGGSEVGSFLASATARATATQQLAALAQGLDGINLDFEFVPSTARDAFTAFVQQVRAALPAGVELTLAMPATTNYSGYDIPKLAAATDRLLLMEYDYHWSSGPNAGAVAPLPAVESAVDAYLARAPASALAMGVPYYGFEWPTVDASPGSRTAGTGRSQTFSAGYLRFSEHGRLWDGASRTPWYHYFGSGSDNQGWIDDDQSLSLKYDLVNRKNLAGIMIWALDYDHARSEAWDAISAAFGPGVPPPGPTNGRGCSQAGPAPLVLILVAAALAGLRRYRPPS